MDMAIYTTKKVMWRSWGNSVDSDEDANLGCVSTVAFCFLDGTIAIQAFLSMALKIVRSRY